ncbi:MAG: hypothetical protein V3V00_16140 [Saprospiraceae bacterium]
MSFAKTVTLDQKSIDFLNILMEDLNIKNFSQALRIAITYATIYKTKTGERNKQAELIAILKYQHSEFIKSVAKNEKVLKEINSILLSRWSDKQKVAKLKEIL